MLGKCICCKRIVLLKGKVCESCIKKIKKSFIYGIGGKIVNKETYDRIIKRGYVIPEELEDIRNE
jgi:hypothetical protein